MDIAPGLTLDADYLAGRSLALLGKRGVGKSTTCRVIVEELSEARVQTLILDPMGVFWGLRADTAGDPNGIAIPVFGGDRGDVPLQPGAGRLMADIAVNEGLSMILDLSAFDSRTQERTFASAFLDRLYRTNTNLTHIVIDEADLFAPQRPQQGDRQLLSTMENVVRRGRNRALGVTLASQRPATLHKDVLSQVDVLGAMRVTSPTDRDAIAAWVRGQGDPETWPTIAATLPTLAVGEAWWWIPENGILTRAQVRRARTFDCSPTRDRTNGVAREPRALADVDLEQIAAQIADTRERAASTDPQLLNERIRSLESENRELRTGAALAAAEPVTVEVSVPYVPDAVSTTITELQEQVATMAGQLEQITTRLAKLHSAVDLVHRDRATGAAPLPAIPPAAAPPAPAPAPVPTTSKPLPVAEPRNTDASSDPKLSASQHRIINSLAELASFGLNEPSRAQLCMWTPRLKSPKASGFRNNLSTLRTFGLLDYPRDGHVVLLPAGAALAEPVAQVPTAEELHRRLREVVSGSQWLILSALINAYPDVLSRDELAEQVAVAGPTASGFRNNLSELRSLGMLDYPAAGTVVGTGRLFLQSD